METHIFSLATDTTMTFTLKKLTLQNFKGFSSQQQFDLGKITILTGANSSGKSSAIYSILGALQTRQFPFTLSPNGKYVNMGDFKEMVNKHDTKKTIIIEFVFNNLEENLDYKISTQWKINKANGLPILHILECNSAWFNMFFKQGASEYLLDVDYFPERDPEATPQHQEIAKITTDTIHRLRSKENRTSDDFSMDYLLDSFSAFSIKSLPIKINGSSLEFKIETGRDYRIRNIFNYVMKIFREFDSNGNFISSFRLQPERTYLERSRNMIKVKTYGEGYLDQIAVWENRDKVKFRELLAMLKRLSMVYSLKTERIGGGRYETRVATKRNALRTPLTDTGFGISQFLPIIVADLQLEYNSTLFIAQPEIHLHPSIQADFGDYLTSQVKEKNKNYVIETHSEYLLNRLRLKVVKGELQEDDIKIYYLEDNEESTIYSMKFNKKGAIEGAPKGFFETYLMDIKNIALNIQ